MCQCALTSNLCGANRMTQSDDKMSRRGLIQGEWFKKIRERGAKLIDTHVEEPIFQIRTPEGQSKRGSVIVQRPPHAVPESEFLAGCTRCDDCIEACPPNAIFRAPDSAGLLAGTPIIDASSQPCLMCDDTPCVPACKAGVLRFDAPIAMGLAVIDEEKCIAFQGEECTICVDHCPVENALTLTAGKPEIHADSCTGCGVCLYVCPAPQNAISQTQRA